MTNPIPNEPQDKNVWKITDHDHHAQTAKLRVGDTSIAFDVPITYLRAIIEEHNQCVDEAVRAARRAAVQQCRERMEAYTPEQRKDLEEKARSIIESTSSGGINLLEEPQISEAARWYFDISKHHTDIFNIFTRDLNCKSVRVADVLNKVASSSTSALNERVREFETTIKFLQAQSKNTMAQRDAVCKERDALKEENARLRNTPNRKGNACDICKWTNSEYNLNIGHGNESKWICHGCVKRMSEENDLIREKLLPFSENEQSTVGIATSVADQLQEARTQLSARDAEIERLKVLVGGTVVYLRKFGIDIREIPRDPSRGRGEPPTEKELKDADEFKRVFLEVDSLRQQLEEAKRELEEINGLNRSESPLTWLQLWNMTEILISDLQSAQEQLDRSERQSAAMREAFAPLLTRIIQQKGNSTDQQAYELRRIIDDFDRYQSALQPDAHKGYAKREALKQAANALISCRNHRYSTGELHHQDFDINAVSNALTAAQAELERTK